MSPAKLSGARAEFGFMDESEGAANPTLCARCGHGLVWHPQMSFDAVTQAVTWSPAGGCSGTDNAGCPERCSVFEVPAEVLGR